MLTFNRSKYDLLIFVDHSIQQLSTQASCLSVSSGDVYKPDLQASSAANSGPILKRSNTANNEAGPSKPKRRRSRVNMFDDNLVAALDRCNVTDRNTVFFIRCYL